jgi:TonB family protein
MDPQHPLRVGSDDYPKESLKNHEQGVCFISFLIEADGTVPAAQLQMSTGFPRLDTACIESVIDVPMLPALVNGTPTTRWSVFPIFWVIDPAHRPHPLGWGFPRIAEHYELRVGKKFYPEAARIKHERGYCVVHTKVDSTGAVRDAYLTHSSDSAILDKACTDAVTAAQFTPETKDGMPVEGSTDIAIYW